MYTCSSVGCNHHELITSSDLKCVKVDLFQYVIGHSVEGRHVIKVG